MIIYQAKLLPAIDGMLTTSITMESGRILKIKVMPNKGKEWVRIELYESITKEQQECINGQE